MQCNIWQKMWYNVTLRLKNAILTKGADKYMGENSKFQKSWTLEIQISKLFSLTGQLSLEKLKIINERCYYNLLNSAFWGWLSIESQPQNLEFRNNPETFTHANMAALTKGPAKQCCYDKWPRQTVPALTNGRGKQCLPWQMAEANSAVLTNGQGKQCCPHKRSSQTVLP